MTGIFVKSDMMARLDQVVFLARPLRGLANHANKKSLDENERPSRPIYGMSLTMSS